MALFVTTRFNHTLGDVTSIGFLVKCDSQRPKPLKLLLEKGYLEMATIQKNQEYATPEKTEEKDCCLFALISGPQPTGKCGFFRDCNVSSHQLF